MQWFPNCGMRTTSGRPTWRLSTWWTNRPTFSRLKFHSQLYFLLIEFCKQIPEFLCTSLVGFENGNKNSCSHFVHAETLSKLSIKRYFAHLLFLEQGGTCWHYRTNKWYVIRQSLGTTDLMQIRSCLPALKPWQPSSIHGTELLQMSWSAKQDMRSKLVSWLLQPIMFSWGQNNSNSYFAS